jgi:uncharacterized protein (TIGR03083 family)
MDPEIEQYVEVWHQAATDVVGLLRALDEAEWERPTDLPGWNVRAVAAHLAHLESELAGNPQETVQVPEAPHVKSLIGQYTETGPAARADWPTDRIIDELEASVEKRYAELRENPPADPSAPGPGFAQLAGWSWATLLSNRPLDVWMHDQDIRRAVGRPGGLDAPAAAHVAGVFDQSLPYVLGKRAGAEPGTSVVLEVTGAQPRTLAATVGDNRRGVALPEPPEDPDARLTMDFESWILLCGGRRTPEQVKVVVSGDEALAQRLLAGLAVTP